LRRDSGQAGGSGGRNWQGTVKFYSRLDATATTFAFLPGGAAGCFRNRKRANSPLRTALNRSIMLGEEKAAGEAGPP